MRSRARSIVVGCALLAASCANLELERETPTSGTFSSSALAFTLLSFDFPSPAIVIARGNAADAGRPNTVITGESVLPHLGPLDWILDILSVRWATVRGTWGYPEEGTPEDEAR